jgi:hypothetical protein
VHIWSYPVTYQTDVQFYILSNAVGHSPRRLTREAESAGAAGYTLTFPSELAQSRYQGDRQATHVYCFYVATLVWRIQCVETKVGLRRTQMVTTESSDQTVSKIVFG